MPNPVAVEPVSGRRDPVPIDARLSISPPRLAIVVLSTTDVRLKTEPLGDEARVERPLKRSRLDPAFAFAPPFRRLDDPSYEARTSRFSTLGRRPSKSAWSTCTLSNLLEGFSFPRVDL